MAFTNEESESIAAICLLAALADGKTEDAERENLERVFSMIDGGAHAGVYQRVVMGKTSAEQEATSLTSDAARSVAYEMAVGVCDADGTTSDAERVFLAKLERALAIDHAAAEQTMEQGDGLATYLLEEEPGDGRFEMAGAAGAGAAAGAAIAPGPAVSVEQQAQADARAAAEREINSMVLKYSILNGAIELLPQDLATVAILPLQTKMVYRIGKRYGYNLSAGHIKEFLGVIGVGMSSQILEGYARKLFGKLAKQTLGKTAGKVAKAATGPAMTFATTYALGQVAKQYYAGGRKLSAVDLKAVFQRSVSEGQRVYQEHAGEVQQEASGLNVSKLMGMVRGRV